MDWKVSIVNTKNVFEFLVFFLFLSATNVFAGGTEKEISSWMLDSSIEH